MEFGHACCKTLAHGVLSVSPIFQVVVDGTMYCLMLLFFLRHLPGGCVPVREASIFGILMLDRSYYICYKLFGIRRDK